MLVIWAVWRWQQRPVFCCMRRFPVSVVCRASNFVWQCWGSIIMDGSWVMNRTQKSYFYTVSKQEGIIFSHQMFIPFSRRLHCTMLNIISHQSAVRCDAIHVQMFMLLFFAKFSKLVGLKLLSRVNETKIFVEASKMCTEQTESVSVVPINDDYFER